MRVGGDGEEELVEFLGLLCYSEVMGLCIPGDVVEVQIQTPQSRRGHCPGIPVGCRDARGPWSARRAGSQTTASEVAQEGASPAVTLGGGGGGGASGSMDRGGESALEEGVRMPNGSLWGVGSHRVCIFTSSGADRCVPLPWLCALFQPDAACC